MPGLSDYLKNRLFDFVFRGVRYDPPAAVYAAIFENDETECSFAGYARVPVSFDAAVGGETANAGLARFPAKGDAGLVVVTHGALFDAPNGGNLLSEVTPLDEARSLGMHDLFEFPVGDILIAWVA